MARQNLENSTPSVRVKMGVQRNKINANFTEIYEGKVDKETGKSLVSTAEKDTWNAKQDPLTLKTVNGESIVGTGNIVISGGDGNVDSVNGILPDGAKNVALTTDNIPQTSEKQYVSTTEKSNWNSASIGSDLGLLKTTDTPPPTGTHKGDVDSAGTYTNFKDASSVAISFTAPELVDNYGFIYVKDNVAAKSLVAKKGGASVETVPAPGPLNLAIGNKVVGERIHQTTLIYGVDAKFDCVIIPVLKNTKYQVSGLVKNTGTAISVQKFDGATYQKLVGDELNYGNNLNVNNIPVNFATGVNTKIIVTPSVDGLFLIINTRYLTSDTFDTLKVVKIEDEILPKIISIKDVDFAKSVKESILSNSSTTTSNINIYNKANDFLGWGNPYTVANPLIEKTSYDSTVIPVDKDSYYTISGDLIAKNSDVGAQNYFLCKKSTSNPNLYVVIPDSELTGYTRPDGVSVSKAWFKSVTTESLTILIPNIVDDVFLIVNTRYISSSIKDTLQIEKGTVATSYKPYSSKSLNDLFGIKFNSSNNASSDSNQWGGKKAYFFGDSTMTTELANLVTEKLKFSITTNYGSSGSDTKRMADIIMGVGYPTKNYTLCDLAVFYIGHNNETNGSVATVEGIDSSLYANDMWGNIGKSIEYIWGQNPNVVIYISTQHLTDRDTYLRSENRAVILKDIAKYYSVPVIDVLTTCGINKKNIDTYLSDKTHQNTAGAGRIARAMSIGLKTK